MAGMTEQVQIPEQLQVRRQRHHRRSPAKRFVLTAGPFLLLTAAFLLSVGVVEIIEKTPVSQPRPTLAQERAEAAAQAPGDPVVQQPSLHVVRIGSFPTALTADDYELRQMAAAAAAREQDLQDGMDPMKHLESTISQRARTDLGR